MNQCGRCLKMTDGAHTCSPSEYARMVEAKLNALIRAVDAVNSTEFDSYYEVSYDEWEALLALVGELRGGR